MYVREELSRRISSRVKLYEVHSVGEATNNVPITTTFSQNGLWKNYLKPVLHEPSFRSVRFSRVHLPVSLHTCFPACRCLGLCDSRNDFCRSIDLRSTQVSVRATGISQRICLSVYFSRRFLPEK